MPASRTLTLQTCYASIRKVRDIPEKYGTRSFSHRTLRVQVRYLPVLYGKRQVKYGQDGVPENMGRRWPIGDKHTSRSHTESRKTIGRQDWHCRKPSKHILVKRLVVWHDAPSVCESLFSFWYTAGFFPIFS